MASPVCRGGLLDFYHRNLFKAVRERNLDTPEKQSAGHARLAAYFQALVKMLSEHVESGGAVPSFHRILTGFPTSRSAAGSRVRAARSTRAPPSARA